MSVEMCKDMSCVVFNETGQEIANQVRNIVDGPFNERKNHDDIRLCVVEEEIKETGELIFVCCFEIGTKDDCS